MYMCIHTYWCICICIYTYVNILMYILYIFTYVCICRYYYPYIPQQTTRNCLRKSSVSVFRNPTGHSGTPCCSVFNFQLGTWVPLEKITACSNSGNDGMFFVKMPGFPQYSIPTQNGISVVLLNCHIDGCISICCMYILEAQPYSWMLVYKPKIILGCCLITW